MNRKGYIRIGVVIAAFALIASMVVGSPGVVAQDTAATPATAEAMAGPNHPGHIHTGTCDAVGDVVYPLDNLMAPGMMGTPEMEDHGDPMATPGMEEDMHMGDVVAESTTTIEASLDDILASDHVVNLHESPENISNYIACGLITGSVDAEGMLEIELEEQNDSGLEGHAMLVDDGAGSIEVTVKLWHVMDDAMGTPEA